MAAAFEVLFESDNSDNEDKISINKAYAKKYKKFKECQELDKRMKYIFTPFVSLFVL